MSNENKIVECRGCGAKIFFEQGVPWFAKRVPILVQKVKTMNDDGTATMEYVKDIGHVSHFVNCPKANDFSRDKKAATRDNAGEGNKAQGGENAGREQANDPTT